MLKLNAQHRLTTCTLCWGHSLDTLSTLRTLLAVCTFALCLCLVQPHQRQWDCAVLIQQKRQPNNIHTSHEYVSSQITRTFSFSSVFLTSCCKQRKACRHGYIWLALQRGSLELWSVTPQWLLFLLQTAPGTTSFPQSPEVPTHRCPQGPLHCASSAHRVWTWTPH